LRIVQNSARPEQVNIYYIIFSEFTLYKDFTVFAENFYFLDKMCIS
jgi:hypothetical protein